MYPKHLPDNVVVYQGNIDPCPLVMGFLACGRSLSTEKTEIIVKYMVITMALVVPFKTTGIEYAMIIVLIFVIKCTF